MIKFKENIPEIKYVTVAEMLAGKTYKMHLPGQWNNSYVLVHNTSQENFATLLTKGEPNGFRSASRHWLDCGRKFEEMDITLDISEK